MKRGKNIAIGGSITETTHANVLYRPNTNISQIHIGIFKPTKKSYIPGSTLNKILDRIWDG